MTTRNINYLLVDWGAAVRAYRDQQGFDFFWAARDEEGEILDGRLPFAAVYDPPYNISILEAAHDASDFYDALRAELDAEVRAACDPHLGALFWSGEGGDHPLAAQDLIVETSIVPPEQAWFVLSPDSVAAQLDRSLAVPFPRLAEALTRTRVPDHLPHVPDFDTFEGYVLTLRSLLESAARRGAGVIALF